MNTQYPIIKMKSAETKYGRQIICELVVDGEPATVFLPSKYNKMGDDDLLRFNNEYVLIVERQVGRTWKLRIEYQK